MHFALLGDHSDGLDFACALAQSGRHSVGVYCGPAVGAEYLRRWSVEFERVGDMEEMLADPAVAAVIVAGRPGDRMAQLRRALQSERHVVCVHPADQTADGAYEAAMIQGDTQQLLLPLLPDALHPGIRRLAEVIRSGEEALLLIEMERWSSEAVLLDADTPGHRPSLPCWDVLRTLGGEIVEIMAFSAPEAVTPEEPLLLAGRFERGALFQVTLVPNRPEPRWRLTAMTRYDQAELSFPQGWPGPARLTWRDADGTPHEESWETWNPWPVLVEVFESALAARHVVRHPVPNRELTAVALQQFTTAPLPRPVAALFPPLTVTWQDAIRCLELDDAARRSVERRRASTLEYQEATEEAGFKGTMTLVGCGLLWGSLVLLILSRWLPWLGWAVAPVFAVFLLLQLLRWVVPKKEGGAVHQGSETNRP